MKILTLFFLLLNGLNITGCSRDTDSDLVRPDDELNIEREEEYKEKDIRESNKLPGEAKELDLEGN